jgi:hypothetical protein
MYLYVCRATLTGVTLFRANDQAALMIRFCEI